MFHLRVFTRNHQFQAIHGDICVAILNFGDESMKKWNLCQMEHVLHSIDLSMEVSQSFWLMESAQGQGKNRISMIWENVRCWKEVHQPLSAQPPCVFCNSFHDLSTLLSWSLEQASWVITGTRQILKFNNL